MNIMNGKTFNHSYRSNVTIKGWIDERNVPTLNIKVSYNGLTSSIEFIPTESHDYEPDTLTQKLVSLFVLDPKGFHTYPKHVRYGISKCVKANNHYFIGQEIKSNGLTLVHKHDTVLAYVKAPGDCFELSDLSVVTRATLKRAISLGMFQTHSDQRQLN